MTRALTPAELYGDAAGDAIHRQLRNVGICPTCRHKVALPCRGCAARKYVADRKAAAELGELALAIAERKQHRRP